jgi:hypothetical protein
MRKSRVRIKWSNVAAPWGCHPIGEDPPTGPPGMVAARVGLSLSDLLFPHLLSMCGLKGLFRPMRDAANGEFACDESVIEGW